MSLWSSQQLLVTLRGPAGPRELVVPRPFARVGSHPDSDVVLDAPGVAKRALYLHATAEGLFCLDLDVEDAVLEKRGRWLTPADALSLGPYELSARLATETILPEPPPASPVAWGSATAPLPVVNVHCRRLLKDKRRFRARLNLVGRRPQCALQLRGTQVSSFHCALYWDQQRLWCIDLLSSNGTQLNGAKIDFAELQLNDRLDVGEFALVYYRWSPRRSMQPGWQPPPAGALPEHDSLETDDSAPVLDAAVPPAAAAADLALAADLADSEGSDVALDAGDLAATQVPPAAPRAIAADQQNERLRQELEQEQARLSDERRQLDAERTALAERLAAEHEATAKSERQWREERQSLAGQLGERAQQLTRLQAEMAASVAALAERQARFDTLARDKATAEAAAARQQAESARLVEALAAAEKLAAERERSVVSPADQQLRERLEADVARLKQERDELQARWSESSGRFAAQVEQATAETTRLAGELSAALSAQDALRAECRQLAARAQSASDRLAESQTLVQQKESQLARLAQERQDLHAQWTAAQQQLASQAERSRDQAARLAEQRTAAEAARREWQAERRALAEQIASRGQQVAALETELAAARAELAERREELVRLRTELAAAPAEQPAMVAEDLVTTDTPRIGTAADSPAEPDELPDWTPGEPAAVVEAAEPTVLPVITVADTPAGRKSKSERHEMTTFIGDRLIVLESRHKRRHLLVWGSVAAGALALSVLILGVWYLLR